MREKRDFTVFGFESTHQALDAEALLGDMGIDVVPVPPPQQMGALCGIALRVPIDQANRALGYLSEVGISPSAQAVFQDL